MSDSFLSDPLFQTLSPMKKAVISDLIEQASNLSLDKAFPLLLRANATLTKNGEAFTPQERNMLIIELTKKLSPEEKKKVAALLKLL